MNNKIFTLGNHTVSFKYNLDGLVVSHFDEYERVTLAKAKELRDFLTGFIEYHKSLKENPMVHLMDSLPKVLNDE